MARSLDDPNMPEIGSWQHPVDNLEADPDEKVVIDAAFKRARFIMDRAIAHVLDSENSETAGWQVAFALGSPHCMGHTMASKAQELGLSKAAISKGATTFCRSVGIEPSIYMLSKKAQESYRALRKKQEAERKK